MRYVVVTNTKKIKLNEEVNAKLRDGWRLQGGVSIIHIGIGFVLAQAMITERE
jgi:hypothetical protein